MLRTKTSGGTSNTISSRVIQLSTLERAHYRRPVYRYMPQPTSIASTVTRLQLVASRSFTGMMVVLLTLFYPASVYANEQPVADSAAAPVAAETQQQIAASPEPAPAPEKTAQQTTSPPASTSTQQASAPLPASDPQPAAASTAWDSTNAEHVYNPETGCWETKDLMCDPDSGRYVTRPKPQPATASSVIKDSDSSLGVGIGSNTGVANDIYSTASTGNALVSGNTVAGGALTGDAAVIANLVNMLNSSMGLTGDSQIATYSSDIHGDVFGDLYIDPSALAATQPASGIDGSNAYLDVNVDLDNKIENNLTLDARSGDATVSGNTQAGSATSGSADAVANIVNMLNSAISTGSSFMGVLNIYGSLNGDILLPAGLLEYLLASNGASGADNNTTDVTLNDSQSIVNNVNASAQSGAATVSGNTQAGNASTGSGETNVTILNLTGRNVIASNSLLVFVNVLGQWVGVIMDAPVGSTSAALGTGVTKDEAYQTAEYDVDTNSEIVNNVDVNARSGDATVANNTVAGDATSGDATASVNIANLVNSSFSLADWFGVLFINVFGTWNGSFGIDTAAGELPAKKPDAKSTPGSAAAAPQVFRFVPNGQGGNTLASVETTSEVSAAAVQQAEKAAKQKVMSESKEQPTQTENDTSSSEDEDTNNANQAVSEPDYFLPVLGFAVGGTLLGGERLVSRRQRRKL